MNRSLIALESFVYPYGRDTMRRGQRFEAESDRDVEILTLAKLAREDDGTSDRDAMTDAEVAKRGKKMNYKTRDMTAE